MRRLTGCLAVVVLTLLATVGDAQAVGPGAALTEPSAALTRALECQGDLRGAARPAVVLVHGTGSSPKESYSFGYEHALQRRGFPVCTVRLPAHGLVDMQRSMQYVVHAIREVHRRSGRKVSLVGHSQGAVLAAYAPYFWADLPAMIDDVVGLAGPYQGSTSVEPSCADGACPPFAWQFRPGSNLNRAFRDKPRPTGPSFTTIATDFDELVTPAPQAGLLAGASNVVLQDVCAARPVDHFLLIGDAVAYALALDALTHPGPADPARVSRTTCLQTIIPGSDLASATATAPLAITNAIFRILNAPSIAREPELRCPFDARACPRPRLRLTRRCTGDGRLRVALVGAVQVVRKVDFKLGRRLLHRDTAAPFATTLGRATPRLASAGRLRAVATLSNPAGELRILSRRLPRC
jgi:pimeloyl-ACP methyl ester carboxylesterase